LNNGQRIEPKNAQNDSDVAYLNMNWQEAVTENFRSKFIWLQDLKQKKY
jgi:hypothetical protein